jgi:NAD(P)H-quinone oxidoreductase subunit 5
MSAAQLSTFLGLTAVGAPALLLAAVGLTALVSRPLGERLTVRLTQIAVSVGLLAAVGVLAVMLTTGSRNVVIDLGNWVALDQQHFHLHVKFIFDRLSVPFAILCFVLIGTIGAFAKHYLHREAGFQRFFLLYAVFLFGMVVASVAGTIETLFFGWELVGLSSALLVAYFHERTGPVVNGQRVWSIYRIADAAFLIAAVTLHHHTGEGDFGVLMGSGPWPEGLAALTSGEALLIGLLLLGAAAGKSALIPFSGWLPRAMEGPTPSSAVFYGALSVHLGVFLLLRVSPILDLSLALSICVVSLGLATAVFAAIAARVQSDVKSSLAFASLTQVGIITAEIGLGFRYIALVHIIGHACLRTLQLVRSPSLLQDYRALENAIGGHLSLEADPLLRRLPDTWRERLYRFGLERGYFDAFINAWIIGPFVGFFQWCNRQELRWTDALSGTPPETPTPLAPFAPPPEPALVGEERR